MNEEPAYKNEPGTTPAPEDGTGYLSMAGMTMRVIYDDQTDTQTRRHVKRNGQAPDARRRGTARCR
ncbi:MAG: hypothetical protein ACLVK4_12235 [Alistipes shahii]|uniref:hypothetical protein n=1 Tax=Alistipes shahii TaxID=328814 RepID=UPI00399C7918